MDLIKFLELLFKFDGDLLFQVAKLAGMEKNFLSKYGWRRVLLTEWSVLPGLSVFQTFNFI